MRVERLFLPGVYLQEVTKRKETLIFSVCPENMCPGAKSAMEQAGLVLDGHSYVHSLRPTGSSTAEKRCSAQPCRLPALPAASHCGPCSRGAVWPIPLALHPSPPASLCKDAPRSALGKPPRNHPGWRRGRPGSLVQRAMRPGGFQASAS